MADLGLDKEALQWVVQKKRLGPTAIKAAVKQVRTEYAFSEHHACGVLEIPVSTFRYAPRTSDTALRERLVELAREKPRFGHLRLHVLLQREGHEVDHKRVHRIYRAAGLALRRKKRKHTVRAGRPLGAYTAANQEWALDFVHDVVQVGRTFRVLTVVDAFTRECLALEVDTSFAGLRVTRVLDEIIARRGAPNAIRCDNVLTREREAGGKKRFLSIPYGMEMTVTPSGFHMQGRSDRP